MNEEIEIQLMILMLKNANTQNDDAHNEESYAYFEGYHQAILDIHKILEDSDKGD